MNKPPVHRRTNEPDRANFVLDWARRMGSWEFSAMPEYVRVPKKTAQKSLLSGQLPAHRAGTQGKSRTNAKKA